jgi:hypothetical protein
MLIYDKRSIHLTSSLFPVFFVTLPGNGQDPEMVREAQKMMMDPEFQNRMKVLMQHPAYQDAMRRSQEMMKDPKKVQALQKQIEKAMNEGKNPIDAAKSAIAGSETNNEVAVGSGNEEEIEDVPVIEVTPIIGPDSKKKANKKKKKTNKKK